MRDKKIVCMTIFLAVLLIAAAIIGPAYADEESTRNVLKQGLLGAGTGAIAAGASGGKAGQGALIGAGTGVIGGVLLDAITQPSQSSSGRRYSRTQSAPPPDEEYYYPDEPAGDYYYEDEPPPQESGTQKVLKQGLLGAGTGAIAAGASGGDAGKGALIGAGTNVIGGALLDAITQPPQQPQRRRVYRRAPQPVTTTTATAQPAATATSDTEAGTHKKVIKKYDANGKLVSEEEVYY